MAKVLGYIVTVLSASVMAIGFMTGLPVVGTMLSNAAPPERQGLVIGTAQSWGSLIRFLSSSFRSKTSSRNSQTLNYFVC